MSNIEVPMIRVSDTSAGSNPVRTYFLPVKFLDYTCPMHRMFQKSGLDSPVHILHNAVLFVQLSELAFRVRFAAVNNLDVLLLVWKLFIDRFAKRIFPIEQHIISIRSRPFAITSEHTAPLDLLTLLKRR